MWHPGATELLATYAASCSRVTAGINLVHVPYRGAQFAFTDLIAGQVQAYFVPTPAAMEYIRTGKLRALAVTTKTRSELMPHIPTVSEFLPGFEASAWQGFGAPRNTPPDIIAKLNTEINNALADPKMKSRLADLGGIAIGGPPNDFGRLIADETEKWANVIRAAGIKPS